MNWIEKEIERERYTELPDPPDGDPVWLDLLTQKQRDTYALRIERGMGRNMSALYHIDRRERAKLDARERETQAARRARPYKLGQFARVRA